MATTSSNLVAGKAPARQGGNGGNGRYGLKAKAVAGVAVLGCAATLAFGGLRAADRPAPQTQPILFPGNVALAQTQAGNGYLEFSSGDVSSTASTAIPMANVARTQTEAGAGYLEFQPGERPVVGTGVSNTAAGIGLREYLGGEGPVAPLPLATPGSQPAPAFGPQP